MKTDKKVIRPIKRSEREEKLELKKRQEILGLLLLYLSLMLFLAIFSFNPAEKPHELGFADSKNLIGFAGSHISHFLIRDTIGYPVLVVPLLLLFWGWMLIRGISSEGIPRWTYHIVFVAVYTSIVLALPEVSLSDGTYYNYDIAGRIGLFLARFLVDLLGFAGCIILLFGLAMALIISTSKMSLAKIIASATVIANGIWQNLLEKQREYRQEREQRLRRKYLIRDQKQKPKRPTPPLRSQDDVVNIHQQRSPQPTQMELEIDKASAPPVQGIEAPSEDRIEPREYEFPPFDLLHEPEEDDGILTKDELLQNAHNLEERLRDFGVRGRVVEINPGPVITRYELEPATGVKVSQFTSLADDLALVLRAKRIRIVAPIPGKAAIGIEIPNPRPATVYLREIVDSEEFNNSHSVLTMGIGKTISGDIFVGDLATMPHLLIGGSTGSGKSVCLNTIIASILFKAHPSQVQFIMIDPKRLELTTYGRLKDYHLTYLEGLNEFVVTNATNAIAVLRSLEVEMERRYQVLNQAGVKNIEEFNRKFDIGQLRSSAETSYRRLEYLVLIVDELADLMLSAAREVEEPIARLTQMSRAVGIHLIVATQRPSVDVITGVIKANFPARIAFQVASKVDSRTILDMNGAEKLLGRGDMLFLPPASPEPIRLHTAFISTDEILRVVDHIQKQPTSSPKFTLPAYYEEQSAGSAFRSERDRDPLFNDAARIVVTHQQGSVSILQRRLKVGYSRAARLIDELEAAGIVGPFEGSKAREVLVDEDGLNDLGL